MLCLKDLLPDTCRHKRARAAAPFPSEAISHKSVQVMLSALHARRCCMPQLKGRCVIKCLRWGVASTEGAAMYKHANGISKKRAAAALRIVAPIARLHQQGIAAAAAHSCQPQPRQAPTARPPRRYRDSSVAAQHVRQAKGQPPSMRRRPRCPALCRAWTGQQCTGTCGGSSTTVSCAHTAATACALSASLSRMLRPPVPGLNLYIAQHAGGHG